MCFLNWLFLLQQAKEMVLELIRDQGGFREVRNEYGSRIGGNEGIDVSKIYTYNFLFFETI